MNEQTHTADIEVEHVPEQAEYDGFDEYSVNIISPRGETPESFYEDVDEYVRENGQFEHVQDNDTQAFGWVSYTSDEILEVNIHSYNRN